MEAAVEEIARKRLCLEVLVERKRDSLDFHDLHITGIMDALRAAYQAGAESASTRRPASG